MSDSRQSAGFSGALTSFFSSVRLTVVLLLTLAVTSIIGTVIPQNQNPSLYVMNYGEFLYRLFSVLDFFDMYHSWWFQLLLILLAVNIVVCSIERLSKTWKIIFPDRVTIRPERFRQASERLEARLPGEPEGYRDKIQNLMSKNFGTGTLYSTDSGYYVWAEKGRWTRLGVYVVHLSVVCLLIGGLIGSIWGFDGYVNIPEGDTVNAIQLSGNNKKHALDFEIRCDKFNIQFYDTGVPSEYRSTLTILQNDKPVITRDIIVNDPLQFNGINFYQSSYSQVPGTGVVLSFVSKATGMEYLEKAVVGQTLSIPEGLGTFTLTDFGMGFQFRGHDIGDAFVGAWKPATGEPVEIVLPVKFPSFDKMRKGDITISIAEMQTRYATGLQITYDPGVWIVYSGFLLMIIGCIITFFMFHQQIYIEAGIEKNQTAIIVSGVSTKNRLGIENRVQRLMNAINK